MTARLTKGQIIDWKITLKDKLSHGDDEVETEKRREEIEILCGMALAHLDSEAKGKWRPISEAPDDLDPVLCWSTDWGYEIWRGKDAKSFVPDGNNIDHHRPEYFLTLSLPPTEVTND